jgi:hypothetical protein
VWLRAGVVECGGSGRGMWPTAKHALALNCCEPCTAHSVPLAVLAAQPAVPVATQSRSV